MRFQVFTPLKEFLKCQIFLFQFLFNLIVLNYAKDFRLERVAGKQA